MMRKTLACLKAPLLVNESLAVIRYVHCTSATSVPRLFSKTAVERRAVLLKDTVAKNYCNNALSFT